ncbi:MAG: hypothetical protein Alpg2KO_18740 [Alphaproteobacteria bacterium]
MIVGLIGVLALAAVTTTGDQVEEVFCITADRLNEATEGQAQVGCLGAGASGSPGAGAYAVTLVEDGGAWRWDNGGSAEYAQDCSAYLSPPSGYQPGSFSDVYWLTINGGSPAKHACDQSSDGGGWTMVARLGTGGTLGHDSANWTNGSEMNASDASPSGASSAIYPAYGQLSGSALRGCVGSDCLTQTLSGETALSVFSGSHRAASFDRSDVTRMVGSSDLDGLPGCASTAAANGINAANGGDAAARFGGLADDTPPCNSPDTAIGIGLKARDGASCSAGSIIASGRPQSGTTVSGYSFIDDNIITQSEGGLFSSYQRPYLAVDWNAGYSYFVESDSNPAESGLRKMRIDSMVEVEQERTSVMKPSTQYGWLDVIAVNDFSGEVYISAEQSNSQPIISVNPDSMSVTGTFGFRSNGLSNTFQRFVTPTFFSTSGNFLFVGSIFDDIGALWGTSYVWGHGQTISRQDVKGVTNDGGGRVYVLGGNRTSSSSSVHIDTYIVAAGANLTPDYPSGTNPWGFSSHTINASDMVSGATQIEFGDVDSFVYDHSDSTLIFNARLTVNGSSNQRYLIKFNPSGGSIVWATRMDGHVNYSSSWDSSYVSGNLGIASGTTFYYVNTGDGSFSSFSINPVQEFGAQVWDSRSKSSILYSNNHGWVRLFVDSSDVPPEPVVTVNCQQGQLWIR